MSKKKLHPQALIVQFNLEADRAFSITHPDWTTGPLRLGEFVEVFAALQHGKPLPYVEEKARAFGQLQRIPQQENSN